jgi:ankyrin repeat protein
MLCGCGRLAKDYIVTRGEGVNAKCGYHGSPLHAASYKKHLEVADVLLAHGADDNLGNNYGKTPFVAAVFAEISMSCGCC